MQQSGAVSVGITIGLVVLLNVISYVFNLGWWFY